MAELRPSSSQTGNKRFFESDLSAQTNGENETVSREVKRHQPLPSESTSGTTSRGFSATTDTITASTTNSPRLSVEDLPDRTFIVRNVGNGATTSDIESLLSPFATEPPIVTFLSSEEALVEMEAADSADRAVQYLNVHTPHIRGSPVSATFSTTGQLNGLDPSECRQAKTDPQSLRVLLVTVTDIRYPVDMELLERLFCPYGKIEKIVTFVKPSNRFQALIQFADPRYAKEATSGLNNKCIYDGCNKIQIQASRLSQLVVKQNNARSWDFTLAALPAKIQEGPGREMTGILSVATNESYTVPGKKYSYGTIGISAHSSQLGNATLMSAAPYISPPQPHHQLLTAMPVLATPHTMAIPSVQFPSQPITPAPVQSPSALPHLVPPHLIEKLPRELQSTSVLHQLNPGQTSVVICYNLPPSEITVHKLFNLLSLYGVVLRIKLLRDKPDTALAQYSHPLYATLACYYLHGAPFFGTDAGLQIGISKKTEVKLPPPNSTSKEAAEEAKRTIAFQPRDQRANAEECEKFIRGACKPTNTLFIANMHESVQEEALRELLSSIGTVVKLEMRPPKQQSKRLTAMAEMGSEKEALSAICHLHNHQLCGCNLKLAFSKQILGSR